MKNFKQIISALVLIILIFLVACTPNYILSDEFYSNVAGVTFENNDGVSRQNLLSKLKSDDKLELKLEPENPHDENAIEVYSEEGKIGYIKKEFAPYIAKLLEEDTKIEVEVAQITGGNKGKFYGCNIKILIYSKNN